MLVWSALTGRVRTVNSANPREFSPLFVFSSFPALRQPKSFVSANSQRVDPRRERQRTRNRGELHQPAHTSVRWGRGPIVCRSSGWLAWRELAAGRIHCSSQLSPVGGRGRGRQRVMTSRPSPATSSSAIARTRGPCLSHLVSRLPPCWPLTFACVRVVDRRSSSSILPLPPPSSSVPRCRPSRRRAASRWPTCRCAASTMATPTRR